MTEEQPTPDQKDSDNRLAVGIALGVPFGVAIALILDNWAFVGVGITLGIVFGAIPPSAWKADSKGPEDTDDGAGGGTGDENGDGER